MRIVRGFAEAHPYTVSAHHQHDMYLLGVITMVARELMPCATIMYQVGMLTTVGAGSYLDVTALSQKQHIFPRNTSECMGASPLAGKFPKVV